MNKQEFTDALRAKLWQLSESEREAQIEYYTEMIDDRIEDGMTEYEAVAELEPPDIIANHILQELPLSTLVKTSIKQKSDGWTAFRILLLVVLCPIWIPLLCAAVAIVLSVIVVIWSIVLALFCVVLALVVCGIFIALAPVLFTLAWGVGPVVMTTAAGLILVGVGALMLIISVYAFKGAVCSCKGIFKGIKSLFIRKEK